LTNPFWQGFSQATIYQGPLKRICHPGLQCYSCPSSITACPLGALQNFLAGFKETIASGNLNFGFFMIGFFGTLGMLFGRLICGFACPFGFLQDLLYALPTPKIKLPRWAEKIKFLFLIILVFAFPIFLSFFEISFYDEKGVFHFLPIFGENKIGVTFPWYCKMICPAGTLEAGMPKAIGEPEIRGSLGFWWRLKWTVMIFFLFLIVVSPRAFCRIGCPIGAIYGIFNSFSLFQIYVDKKSCIKCGQCEALCPVDLRVEEISRNSACIRCLKCISACPKKLITLGFSNGETTRNN